MTSFKTVLIVGTGLIGGSLALAMRAAHPSLKIIGLDQNSDSLNQALASGAITTLGSSFKAAAVVSDCIILCTPVKQTSHYLTELDSLELVKPVLVTDVGSTKSEVMAVVANLTQPFLSFIGGHPMAGSHKSGFIAADRDLFENAYYVLTPSKKSSTQQLSDLTALLKGTRAKFITLGAEEHDQVTGMVSHLPHIIAAGLVQQNQDVAADLPLAKQLAAGGFRDITRIASSDPEMWTDILLSNQSVLLAHLEEWRQLMARVQGWLETSNSAEIHAFFANAKAARDALPQRKSGAIPAFNDLFVEVPDYAGEIAKITRLIAEENLSLTNLKILENREDIFGTLQLTFKNQRDVSVAQSLLEREGQYKCYEK